MSDAIRPAHPSGALTTALLQAHRSRFGLFPEPAPGGGPPPWNEVLDGSDEIRPDWRGLADSVDDLGPAGLAGLSGLVDRLVEDDAVSYTPLPEAADPASTPATSDAPEQTASAAPGATAAPEFRRWPLDPLPLLVGAGEWAGLEAGLVQRSTLLDAVLTDIYSERRIISRGWVPPEIVFGHRNYLRIAHRTAIPGAHQLFFHAADLCRSGDGTFTVLSDRTQAPSGSAYAMAGRRIVATVLPEAFRRQAPRGLAGFFASMRAALQAVAPPHADDPRVVVLSPGTHSETAFDQAHLATLLGVPLVESADLTVRAGRLWMRALGRYEPVDVLVRRVDASWSDPLDLRPDSQLGVVGLAQACRNGAVTVVNPLGSGVVENPGLLAFLPRLCRELLGEELRLPTVPTLWCGDRAERARVLAELDQLVLKPVDGGVPVVPALLTAAARSDLRARIDREPTRWVGQRPAPFAQAPTVAGADVTMRRVGFRAFTVAHESGYVVMPGGLGRVVRDPLLPAGAEQGRAAGHVVAAKDVWVSRAAAGFGAAATARPPVRRDDAVPLTEPVRMTAAASPRVLEDLFWLGRYAERAEDLTRLLIVSREQADVWRLRSTEAAAAAFPVLLQTVSTLSADAIGFPAGRDPMPGLRRALLDGQTAGTVAQSLAGLGDAARAVRDQLSSDTWTVLAAVDRALSELSADPGDAGSHTERAHAAVLSGMLALSGLAAENMVRDPGWYLLDIGRRIERADQLVILLRSTLDAARPSDVESAVIESVLAAAESGVTYRRRYRGRVQVGTVLELLVLDPGNPRSLAYQVDALADDLRRLPDAAGTSRPERLTEDLTVLLRRADPAQLDDADEHGIRTGLREFLDAVRDGLRGLADAVAEQHFWRSRPMLPLGPRQTAGL